MASACFTDVFWHKKSLFLEGKKTLKKVNTLFIGYRRKIL